MRRTRRQALGLIGGGLGMVALAACGQAPPTATPQPAPAKPAEAPKPAAPAAPPTAVPPTATTAPAKPAPTPTSPPAKPAATPTSAPAKPAATVEPTPTPVPQSTLAAKPGKVTIEMWHKYGVAPQRPIFLELLKEFNEKTGIGINESKNSDCCDPRFGQKFVAAAAAGQVPDVWFNPSPIGWGSRGVLLPLNDYMARDKFLLKEPEWWAFPVVLSGWEGKTYGIPYETDTRATFWNKKHFTEAGLDPEKPPKTWLELKQVAQKLLKKDGTRIVRIGFSPLYGEAYQWTWMGTAGGYPWFDMDQKPPKSRFDTPQSIKAHEFMLELSELNGGVTQIRAFQQGFQTGVSHPFLTGQASIFYGGSWYPPQIKQFKPDWEYERDYGITDHAIADEGGKNFCLVGGWSNMIPKDAKLKDQAWEFLRWFADDAQMLRWCSAAGTIPTKRAVAENPTLRNLKPLGFFVGLMRYGQGFPAGLWTGAPRYGMGNALDDILFKKRSAKDALTEANNEQQRIINEYDAGKK